MIGKTTEPKSKNYEEVRCVICNGNFIRRKFSRKGGRGLRLRGFVIRRFGSVTCSPECSRKHTLNTKNNYYKQKHLKRNSN